MIINKYNKRDGNTILLILIISMVMVIMLGTAISAMLFTTRGNSVVKVEDDLLYAAEGGSELGVALVRKDIKYENSKNTITNPGIQLDIDAKAAKLQSDTIHSVNIITEPDGVITNNIKITSTAYGKQSDGTKDLNRKKTLSKVIKRTNNGSADIFKNSIVAEETVDIEILPGGGMDMDETRVTGGIEIKLPTASAGPPAITHPTKYNYVFERPVFKSNVHSNSQVRANSIAGATLGTTLISKAKILDLNGGTDVDTGIGKFELHGYKIILVNSPDLEIKADSTGLFEYKTILISSGNIYLDMGNHSNTLVMSNIFGENIKLKTPGSLNINESPLAMSAIGVNTDFLTKAQLEDIDRVLSLYIENWNSSTPGGGNGAGKWEEVESETVYE